MSHACVRVAVRTTVNTWLCVCRGGVPTLSEVAPEACLLHPEYSFQISSSHLPVLFFSSVTGFFFFFPSFLLLSGRAGLDFNESVADKKT